MARREITLTIDAEGRDKAKVFLLRELPATAAEWWATRAFMALAKSGVDIPENVSQAGLAGIASIGFRALGGADPFLVKPLMDEMMECVEIVPDPGRPAVKRRLFDGDIEEIATIIKLRTEVFKLHTDFFQSAAPSK